MDLCGPLSQEAYKDQKGKSAKWLSNTGLQMGIRKRLQNIVKEASTFDKLSNLLSGWETKIKKKSKRLKVIFPDDISEPFSMPSKQEILERSSKVKLLMYPRVPKTGSTFFLDMIKVCILRILGCLDHSVAHLIWKIFLPFRTLSIRKS